MGLLEKTRAALKAVADPAKARAMQAYMKSAMPYHGVSSVPFKATMKAVLAEHPVTGFEGWQRDVRALWRGAKFREERYAAIALTGDRRAREFQTPAALPLYEELITTGAWWDYVDELASNRVGPILEAHPGPMKKAMRAWSVDAHLWKRRTSIISQLFFERETDLELLYACIDPSLQASQKGGQESPVARDFFIRKAIGWALRQYARTDPDEVRRYVEENSQRLSGLSIREALKHL